MLLVKCRKFCLQSQGELKSTDSAPGRFSVWLQDLICHTGCHKPWLGVLGEGAQAAGVHVSSYINVNGCVGFGELGWCRDASGAQRRQRDQLLTWHTAAASTVLWWYEWERRYDRVMWFHFPAQLPFTKFHISHGLFHCEYIIWANFSNSIFKPFTVNHVAIIGVSDLLSRGCFKNHNISSTRDFVLLNIYCPTSLRSTKSMCRGIEWNPESNTLTYLTWSSSVSRSQGYFFKLWQGIIFHQPWC